MGTLPRWRTISQICQKFQNGLRLVERSSWAVKCAKVDKNQSDIVYSAAVIRVVTQRFTMREVW